MKKHYMIKKRKLIGEILLAATFISITFAISVQAGPISPVSYNMANGQSGQYSYWDDSYNGSGNKNSDLAQLTGGLGDLTDGIIATQNWNVNNGPYVGWYLINPIIDFNFGNSVSVNTVTIYVDDGPVDVYSPVSAVISMGGTVKNFNIVDPQTGSPFSISFSNLGLYGNTLSLTLNRYPASGYSWVMLSEVTFDGTNGNSVPEPTTMLLLGLGLIGVAGVRRKIQK